jgi:hypothetical protein
MLVYDLEESVMFELKYPRNKIYDESFLDKCDPKIAAFYQEYCVRKQGRTMPGRQDFDPLDIKRFLSGITLVEKDRETGELFYRLAGTEAVELRKKDPTGKPVKDYFYGDSWEEVEENYRYVCERKSFIYDHTVDEEKIGKFFHEEIMFLPLSDDDDFVNIIMLYSVKRLNDSA